MSQETRLSSLIELAALFFKLGVIGFGGPAAHIAMMEDEVVSRRKWLSRQHFLDLVGATNLIPGPNSTEMAIHVGFIRNGWPGLVVAGLCFILPAVLITTAFAWAYVRFGSLPQVAPFLIGIKPVVLAIILGAVWKLGRTATKNRQLLVIGTAVLVASLLNLNEVLAMLAGGVLGMLWLRLWERLAARQEGQSVAGALVGLAGGVSAASQKGLAAVLGLGAGTAAGVSLIELGLFFLKVGAVLYGSGYVLVAFLEGGLVHDYGWLTQQQLLDAIAIGQFTPGPVLSTAAFIGYILADIPGAAISAFAIFLPSFFFVAILNPIVPRLRHSPWTAAFLDAVNVSAVALMVAVTIKLGQATLTSGLAWLIVLVAAVLTVRWKVSAFWMVLGGAVLGWGGATLLGVPV